MLGLRRGLSHPGADKGIEHFAESGENGLELFSDVRRLTSHRRNIGIAKRARSRRAFMPRL